MSRKRSFYGLVAVLFAVATLGLFAGTASAQYTPTVTITCNKTRVTVGESVTCTATGFNANTDVAWVFNSTPVALGTTQSNGSNVATITFPTPNVDLGGHTVSATGLVGAGGTVATVTVATDIEVVTAGSNSGNGSLPKTGSDSTDLLRIGALLVAAGGVVVLITRKRAQAKINV